MASFSRKTRIVGALVIAGVLVVGSIVISGAGLSFLNPLTVNAASTQELLQSFATRDSDNDGLPDWEEELYGLDPNNAHSFSPNMTDGEAVARGLVKPKFMTQEIASSTSATTTDPYPDAPTAAPGSLTEQFSQALLTQYLSTNPAGSVPSESDIATLAQGTMQAFAQTHQHKDPYTINQIHVSGSGPLALSKYAVAMEGVFAKNTTSHEKSEIDYFTDALQKNDPLALKEVVNIGAEYSSIAPAFMNTDVPIEMQNAHLEFANAASRIGADITDMGMLNSDPLRAYFGLAQYETDASSLVKGMSDIGSVFAAEKFSLQQGDPGYVFYVSSVTELQKQSTQQTSAVTAPNL